MLKTKTKDSILRQLTEAPFRPVKIAKQDDSSDEELVYVENNVIGLDEGIKRITKYNYMGEDSLDADMPKQGISHLVCYNIITAAINPFISFYMEAGETEVSLPVVDTSSTSWKPANSVYQGHYIYDGDVYVFVEMKDIHDVEMYSVKNSRISCIVDDICNKGRVYNLSVNKNTQRFFLNNDQFIRLSNTDGELIDTPVSGYFGSYWKRIAVTAALGPFVMTPYASLGPYYYFSEYNRALRFAVGQKSMGQDFKDTRLQFTRENTGIFTKGGIVKFALFLGRSKVLLNRDSDPDDNSEFTLDSAKRNAFVNATIKIRDNDGKWTNDYDSIITTSYPNIKLENVQTLDSQTVLKRYSQQIPVSYVYIDTSEVKPTEEALTYEDAHML